MGSLKFAAEVIRGLDCAVREAIAKQHGGEVVCGAIAVPGDPTNSHNLLANLNDIDALARDIAKQRKGR